MPAPAPDLAAWLEEPGISYPMVELWQYGRKVADLSPLTASTTYDAEAGIPRSCQITVAGFEGLVPDVGSLPPAGTFADTTGTFGDGIFGDLSNRVIRGLAVAGITQIRYKSRLVTPSGSFIDVPRGYFWLDKPAFAAQVGDYVEVSLSGVDVVHKISLSGYPEPWLCPAGTNVATALRSLLTYLVPGIAVTTPVTTATTPRLAFVQAGAVNPWADAQKVAASAGWQLTTDRTGGVVAFSAPSPGSGTAVWEINEARNASARTQQDDRNAVNVFIVDGQTAENVPVRGVAYMRGGTWGTDSIGFRPKQETSPFVSTVDQAVAFAQARLDASKGLVDQVVFDCDWAPHLDQWELIDTFDRLLQLEDTSYRLVRIVTDDVAMSSQITVARRLA